MSWLVPMLIDTLVLCAIAQRALRALASCSLLRPSSLAQVPPPAEVEVSKSVVQLFLSTSRVIKEF